MSSGNYAPLRRGDVLLSFFSTLWVAEWDNDHWVRKDVPLPTHNGWPLILRGQVQPLDFDFCEDF